MFDFRAAEKEFSALKAKPEKTELKQASIPIVDTNLTGESDFSVHFHVHGKWTLGEQKLKECLNSEKLGIKKVHFYVVKNKGRNVMKNYGLLYFENEINCQLRLLKQLKFWTL